MMFRRLPTPLIIYFSLVLGCGASLSTSSLADYFETPRYSGDVQPISSGDEVLIAGTDSDSHEAKSLIQLLESFLLSNTRNSDRAWWISTSGSISVIDEEDGVRAIIPDVKVVFNIGKKETPLVEIGDLELRISQESGEGLNISVQLPSRIVLRNTNGTVGFEIRIGSSKFSLIWDTVLKTIVGNHIDFQGISFTSNDNFTAQVERIALIGKLDERSKGIWSGSQTFRMENLVSSIIKIDEVETQQSVKNLRLNVFTTAIKEIDHDGRFGSWFFGGAFYPNKLYEYSLTRENVIPFIDAARIALPSMGDVSLRVFIHNFSMPGLFSITEIRAPSDIRRDTSGLANVSSQLTLDGINVPTKPDIVAFQDLIPHSVKFDFNLDRIPEISLIDILRTVTVAALKKDWSVMSKREMEDAILKLLFTHIGELSKILAKAKTTVSINDFVIKAPLYETYLKGEVTAEPNAAGMFLGNMELNVSDDKMVINQIIENLLTQKLKIGQKISGVTSSPSNYTYRLAVGQDGRIRLNGTDLGPLLPENTGLEKTPPLTERKIEMPTLPREKVSGEKEDIEKRLRRLKTLFEKGLIQRDEYDEKRREIIKSL